MSRATARAVCVHRPRELQWIWASGMRSTGTANQDFFYLIIDTGGAKNPKIFAQAFDSDGSMIGGDPNVVRARNCRPPVRNFGCVDTDHPDYSKKSGIYPIRFPTTDPRGGYR